MPILSTWDASTDASTLFQELPAKPQVSFRVHLLSLDDYDFGEVAARGL